MVFRLLRFTVKYWAEFLAAVILMALAGAFSAAQVFLIQPVVDRVLQTSSGGGPVVLGTLPFIHKTVTLGALFPHWFSPHRNPGTLIVSAFVVSVIFAAVTEYGGTCLIGRVGYGVVTDLRNRLYEKLIHQSAAFFQRHATGKLMSTTVNDIERIQFAAANSLADALQQTFIFLAMAALLLHINWRLTLYASVLAPLVIWPAARIGKKVRRTTRKGQDEMADVQHILHETFTGNRIVKAFNMEAREVQRFRDAARRLYRYNVRYIQQQGISSPLMEMMGGVTLGGLLLFSRSLIAQHIMTIGGFTAFLIALFKLYDPLRRMSGIYNSFQTAAGSAERVFEILDTDDEVRNRPGARAASDFRHGIRFEQVAFRYRENEPLLDGLDFEVTRGEVVALVGSSGAGKTTLVNLIPRFFDVTGGRVLLDGVDIRDLELRSLRQQVAYVTQDTILFNDTVAGNIGYGSSDASEEQLRAAARAALADDFIAAMPDGYQTLLGERGLRLSGGQRQRIAIARAILKNAPILILDEATSALDNESELLVQRALANLMRNRTAIVIAHRLSTVRNADRILVVDHGRVAETGTHEQLHAQGGIYRRLYDLQFADVDEAPTPEPAAAT